MAGPATAFYLANQLGRSQPTVWRGVAALGDGAVRIGAARSIQYALRDTVRGLADAGYISRAAADTAALLYAFGTLTGNTDMHPGNLSFLSDVGPPCELSPPYDMLPTALAPRLSGALATALPPPLANMADTTDVNAQYKQADEKAVQDTLVDRLKNLI